MERAFCFRLYPNAEQTRLLERTLQIHRSLYNDALRERKLAYRMRGITLHYPEQARQLTLIRQFDPDAAWLNHSATQQTLRRLEKAYQAFFDRRKVDPEAGPPRYKSAQRFRSVACVYGDGIKLDPETGRLYVQRIGRVRLFQHRPFPDGAQIKQVVLHRNAAGAWHATFQLALPDPLAGPLPSGDPVGVDVGLLCYAALSTGEEVANPRWRRTAEAHLAELQSRKARHTRGSKRARALGRQIGRLHDHTARRRRDFQHKLARRLVEQHPLIAVEALNVQGLARGRLAKSVTDAAWGAFLTLLDEKAASAGVEFVRVAPHGTSQHCARCRAYTPKDLSDRVHVCPHCDFTASRDVNAACLILARALDQRDTARTGSPLKGFLASQGAGSWEAAGF